MDVFNGYLKSIEAPCLRDLDLGTESLHEVLIDNTVTRSKECQHMLDKVTLFRLRKANECVTQLPINTT